MASDYTKPWHLGDLTLIVQGKPIYASRAVLSVCSEPFQQKLSQEYYNQKGPLQLELAGKSYQDVLELVKVTHPPPAPVTGRSKVKDGVGIRFLIFSILFFITYLSIFYFLFHILGEFLLYMYTVHVTGFETPIFVVLTTYAMKTLFFYIVCCHWLQMTTMREYYHWLKSTR